MTDGTLIGSDIDGVGSDGDGRGEISLLPARSRFAGERRGAQQRAAQAPKMANVRAGVGGTLVKADGGDGTGGVRFNRDTQFQWAVGAVVNSCRHSGARPNGLLGRRAKRQEQNRGDAK